MPKGLVKNDGDAMRDIYSNESAIVLERKIINAKTVKLNVARI